MTSLFITADTVGAVSGGGAVTANELEALRGMGTGFVWDREMLRYHVTGEDPWCWDNAALACINRSHGEVDHVHFYAGTFTETIKEIRKKWPKCKLSYTAAAHSIEESRREHKSCGFQFAYPHLTDPELWKRYVGGYVAADVVVCPSAHSADCMRSYGCRNVRIVPHGCHLPDRVASPPSRYVVGYLGAYGPDKGVRYLLEAWRKLNYQDGSMLALAGRDSTSHYVMDLVARFGGDRVNLVAEVEDVDNPVKLDRLQVFSATCGLIKLLGWMDDVSDFYNGISLYVQPSVTEGFGIEIAEALSHNRPVICSTGAGASDVVTRNCGMLVPPRDVDALAGAIESYKCDVILRKLHGGNGRKIVECMTWDKVRKKYQEVWTSLLR